MRYCNPNKVGQNIYNSNHVLIGVVSKGGHLTLTGEFDPTDHNDLIAQGFTTDEPQAETAEPEAEE